MIVTQAREVNEVHIHTTSGLTTQENLTVDEPNLTINGMLTKDCDRVKGKNRKRNSLETKELN